MSTEAQVRELESLLGRIHDNRTDAPVRYPDAASKIELKSDVPALELEAEPELAGPATERPPPPRRPSPATPMEKAISGELSLDYEDDDEPEISVSYPDDDEPELRIEEPPEAPVAELEAPTAPIGTPSPAAARGPATLDLDEARPSAPVGKVVARAAPKTFGELLDRALALRPR